MKKQTDWELGNTKNTKRRQEASKKERSPIEQASKQSKKLQVKKLQYRFTDRVSEKDRR